MRTVLPVLIVAATLVAVWGIGVLKSSGPKPSQGVLTAVENPDYVQIDYQNKVKVVATYLPSEGTPTEAKVKVELSSDVLDLSSYNYQEKIIWADTNIYPLPTLRSEVISSTSNRLTLKMAFGRNEGSHYHLLIKDLAGVKDRVLHFYGL